MTFLAITLWDYIFVRFVSVGAYWVLVLLWSILCYFLSCVFVWISPPKMRILNLSKILYVRVTHLPNTEFLYDDNINAYNTHSSKSIVVVSITSCNASIVSKNIWRMTWHVTAFCPFGLAKRKLTCVHLPQTQHLRTVI